MCHRCSRLVHESTASAGAITEKSRYLLYLMLFGETRRGLVYSLWGLPDQSGRPGCLAWVVGHWRTRKNRSSSLKLGRYLTRVRCRDPPRGQRSPPERTCATPQPSTRFRDRSYGHPHHCYTCSNQPHPRSITVCKVTILTRTQMYVLVW